MLREEAGLSQRDLAKLTGIDHYPFITQIERGAARVPADRFLQWAQALGVHPRDFAIKLMRYYDRALYEILFTEFEPRQPGVAARENAIKNLQNAPAGPKLKERDPS